MKTCIMQENDCDDENDETQMMEIIVKEPSLKQYDDNLLNIELLKFYLLKLNQEGRSNKMDLKMYCSMYHEFLKLFIHLGKAIKFAFSGKFHKTYSKIEMLTILFFIFRYQ